MADGPKSFRINDETMDRFKMITEELGCNQQDGFQKLLDTFELKKQKTRHPELENFEKYTLLLTQLYATVLEDNQNITETTQAQFAEQIKSKDSLVMGLQEQLAAAVQLKEHAVVQAKTLTDENITYKKENEGLQEKVLKLTTEYQVELKKETDNFNTALQDKDKLNRILQETCTEQKKKIAELQEELNQYPGILTEIEKLKCHLAKEQKEKEKLAVEKESLQSNHEVALQTLTSKLQLDKEKALMELERKHNSLISAIMEKHQREIEEYNARYLALMEQIRDNKEEVTMDSQS